MARQRNKSKKRVALPLLDELDGLKQDMFNKDIAWQTPDYIYNNMVHRFRAYQNEALLHFHYSQVNESFKHRNINHVLFNMATGSGKTDLMVGLILYLFKEHDYQNFLFMVDKNAIVQKTEDNLINSSSDKYLFSEQIEIEGDRITIKKVDEFPKHQNKNTIYIKLDTVQTISSHLYTQRENTMGEKEYSLNKVVILGDEAHHYSASTKKEKEKEQSWENAISKILNVRDDNKLLEFTATIDIDNNKNIYEKYKDKIIYYYALDSFINDGFSKYVKRVQTTNTDEANMLNAVLLSEYRRRYALERYKTTIKPVVMFKSQRVQASNEAEETFNNLIENLTVNGILEFISRQKAMGEEAVNHTLILAYEYYESNKEDLMNVIREIQREFSRNRIINANDTSQTGILEKGQYENLNSLESPSNIYRVVFAVAKLTEGWDVLNLYDIVRLGNDPKTKGTEATTMSEAQLIGRGARYNPFKLNDKRSYTRRFERDTKESLLLETIHYHTINEPQYLKNLIDALEKMNLPTGQDEENPPLPVRVKPSFKKTNVWKYGKVYYNETVKVSDDYYDSLNKYGIKTNGDAVIDYIRSSQELDYRKRDTLSEASDLHNVVIKFDRRYINKILHTNSFFHFNNLKQYIPLLQSMDDFLSDKWLNIYNRTFFARVPTNMTSDDLTPQEKLEILETYFMELEKKIKKGYSRRKGTGKFIGYPIRDYITDYNKRIPRLDTANHSIQQVVNRTVIEEEHFVYDSAIINQTERELVDRIGERIDELRDEYKDVYLIRMDENMHRESTKGDDLKLHQFGEVEDDYRLEGFQPDFILYLKNSDYVIQIFIEPKGMNIDAEQWKENLLLYLNENEAEIIFVDETDDVKIKGVKFYTRGDERNTIKQIAEIALGHDFESLSLLD